MGTDGICEARDCRGELFGRERLHSLIAGSAERAAGEICDTVIDEVAKFVYPASRSDDVTLIVVRATE